MYALIRRRRASLLVAMLAIGVLGGCGPTRPPAIYAVRGRVLDAATKHGVPQARLMLRALVVQEGGVVATRSASTLVAYGFTDADGEYVVELPEGFEILERAKQIRISAVKNSYGPASLDIPPPTRKEPFYKLPDILIVQSGSAAWEEK
jgi:hypothetical protein